MRDGLILDRELAATPLAPPGEQVPEVRRISRVDTLARRLT